MADDTNTPQSQLEAGTYEVVRQRLADQGEVLKGKVDELNRRRLELFGSQGIALQHTLHVTTEHNCVPRDLVRASDDKLLFGYQVYLGLKSEIQVGDVFTKLRFDGEHLHLTEREALATPEFVRDFQELFQYYKDARLLQLRRTETQLLMVFQTGARESDFKVLRWALVDGGLQYVDNRGERDHTFPPRHAFEWTATTREDHVLGQHPHVNVCDTIFVECVEGDLTIKVEDNTDSGAGIFAEPVDDLTQGLDDADIHYADLEGLILLKIRPYREQTWRYIVYNKQTAEAVRLDAIGTSCQVLPEGHGIVFPNGYYLANGVYKVFPHDAEGLEYVRQFRSPNGEDMLFVFHHKQEGRYVLLHYNLITREVSNPQIVNGYAFFDDGRMVVFRSDQEPTRTHAMQVWETPFTSEAFAVANRRGGDTFLGRIGNRDLVRGISDLLYTHRLIASQRPTVQVYHDLLATITRVRDSYHWLDHDEACGISAALNELSDTADKIIGEFDKVRQLTEQARGRVESLESEVKALLRDLDLEARESIDDYVRQLSAVRAKRGAVDTAREVRYVDHAALDAIDQRLVKAADATAAGAVEFLLRPGALNTYATEITDLESRAEAITKVADTPELGERLSQLAEGLDLLMGIVNTLDIDDATARTEILERISEVYGQLNRAKAVLEGQRKALGTREGRAEFGAQFTILGQTVSSYLGMCSEPDACDEFLGKIMIQIEELESKFIEFDEFAEELTAKREEIYEAFQGRKQSLLDERQRTANSLGRAADRILDGVARRALSFSQMDALNAYFASDAMVMKVRSIGDQLRGLGDTVKSDDIDSRIKTARENGVRALRDKSELFEGDTIKFGRHRFSVNTQKLALTLLEREEGMCFHLAGTDYYGPVEDEAFLATRPYWSRDLLSENDAVYRGEYLAYQMLQAADAGREGLTLDLLHATGTDDELIALVRRFAEGRYEEGYERGIHDADAARILRALVHLRDTCGLLRFPVEARVLGLLYWADASQQRRTELRHHCPSLLRLRAAFGPSQALDRLAGDLAEEVTVTARRWGLDDSPTLRAEAGAFLVEQLGVEGELRFVRSGEGEDLERAFLEQLGLKGLRDAFLADLAALTERPAARLDLARSWLERYVARESSAAGATVPEVAAALVVGPDIEREAIHARAAVTVEGLLGQHPRIDNKCMEVRIDRFTARLGRFSAEDVPGYRAYQQLRNRLVEGERERLRLEEFEPRVLTSFVRNRLINEVYLPLIGDNLAKQMGTVGENKRTDLMGLLLLISPPGYGKTTLMEYVASVLGLTFMKINGPAIGHNVMSTDPAEAPNATARQELEKLNLSFEMGNNVLIYLDDIQHCNPEFLQKFISLCDGQRRIEGVWRGRTRTYDLRGKKVAVVMAGNPYTESGEKFQIPDMLANRADTYNLGDILGGKEDVFELSYLENCLTANPVLNPLASRSRDDFYKLLRIAGGDDDLRSDLEHPYSAVELDEICDVLNKLGRVQRLLLTVNQQYIASASQSDDYRTEPAFKLQGSYRNMAKLAEKVVAVMNEEELTQLLLDHYRGEAQTLTTGAEANLLKLRELMGLLDGDDLARWNEIKRGFQRKQELGDDDADPMQQALVQLIRLGERLDDIRATIERSAVKGGDEGVAASAAAQVAAAVRELAPALGGIGGQLQPAVMALGSALEQAVEGVGEQVGGIGSALAQALAQLPTGGAVPSAGQPAPMPEIKPTIQVVNTLPKYYGRLYQLQIEVIDKSLRPAVEAMAKHLEGADEIRSQLGRLVEYLRKRVASQADAQSLHLDGEDHQQLG